MQHVPVYDDACTDARAYGDEHGAMAFLGRALPHFAVHVARTVAVYVDFYVFWGYSSQIFVERVVFPFGDVGRPHAFGLRIYYARHAHTHAFYGDAAPAGGSQQFFKDFGGELAYFVPRPTLQELLAVVEHTSVGKVNGAGYFGAADVESYCCHGIR